jgi:hypothetical protein
MLSCHTELGVMRAKGKAIASVSALICLAMGVLGAPARAAIITTGTYPSVGTAGNGTATVLSNPPNFDITSAAKSFTSIGPLDFVFPVTYTDNNSTVTYFVSEGITNNTTSTWSDYHEQIGTGSDGQFTLGSNPVTFVDPPDSTFTNPPFPSITDSTDEIDYFGGTVAPGQAISLTFSIIVPDNGTSPYSFTLRQFPTVVPEPAGVGLIVMAGLGTLAQRRRK